MGGATCYREVFFGAAIEMVDENELCIYFSGWTYLRSVC